MAFTPVENPDLRTYDILPDGGLGITAYYPLGNRTLKQCALIPGQTLPRDSTAGIVGGAIQISDSVRYGVVKAHQAEYLYATAQDRTGTVTGAYGATTVVTATTPIFYPGLVGESVVIADTGTFTVASYTSPTVIVITADATCSAKTITLTEGSRLLSESVSDAYRWNRKGRWRCVRRYHCLTANRDAEARVLGATKYTFAADEFWG